MTRIMRVSLGRLTTTVLLCVGLVVAGCGQALAVTYTWTQFGNGTYSWSTTSNWNAGGAAVSGSTTTVTFGTGASGTLPNSFNTISNINNGGTTFTLNNLNFNNTTGSPTTSGTLTLAGDSLTFVNNASTVPLIDLNTGTSSSGPNRPFQVINNNIILSTGSAAASGTGLNIAVSSNNSNLTINGSISGTGGFYKTGSGVVYLTATNSFTGDININRCGHIRVRAVGVDWHLCRQHHRHVVGCIHLQQCRHPVSHRLHLRWRRGWWQCPADVGAWFASSIGQQHVLRHHNDHIRHAPTGILDRARKFEPGNNFESQFGRNGP